MKIKLNKQIKITLIAVILGLIVFVSVLLYNLINNQEYIEQRQTIHNYSSKSNVNYSVNLKPNKLYNDHQLSEDNIYLSSYVDNIRAVFNYTFKGDKTSDIKGSYTIIASVEGYSGDKSSSKTIWKKEFEILPKETIDISDKEFTIAKEVALSFNEYNSFAQKIIEESKITIPVKLTVSMVVNLSDNVEGNIIEKNSVPSIVIPLNTPYFEITKSGIEEKPGIIQITNSHSKEKDKKVIFILATAEFIFFLGLIYILFFAVSISKNNIFEKKVDKIFKEYGSRLVGLSKESNKNYVNRYSIKSIQDLVKVADELSKPIFYNHCSENNIITKFYVVENEQVYEYDLLDELKYYNRNEKVAKQMKTFNE